VSLNHLWNQWSIEKMASAIEVINLDTKLQNHKQAMIQKKAEELFRIYSDSMNEQGADYCVNFEYLNTRSKNAWLKVAEGIFENETT
jgi:hypothetical protein